MLKIYFELNGKRINPRSIGDAIMQAVLQNIEAQIREQVGSVRDPETGEFPSIVVRGDDLDNLNFRVEGSEKLIELVRERLGLESEDEEINKPQHDGPPRAFLSYASDDAELAERIARKLQSSGIDTWWDRWCIRAGESLRQKIDDGLRECTHFLVLLTPQSIGKPWVNQEMDAGFVRKLKDNCIFMPVRFELQASGLPPLLSGMHAPEIKADEDITQLVNDIHGVSRKPPLGPSPYKQAAEVATETGYSVAANTVARYFVEATRYARFGDPMIDVEPLSEATGLTLDDTKDALYELADFFKDTRIHALVKASLFAEFDRYWKPWDPREDALKLAADIMNDEKFPAQSKTIAELYVWEPRRLNPAATYLHERGMLVDYKVLGDLEFELHRVVGKPDELRRFLKSRR
jgi:TIR domain